MLVETRVIVLHYALTVCVYLHSNFSGGRRKTFLFLSIFTKGAF